MGRPYSLDLRDRVARFVVSGGSCREAAERFGVGVATAVRWSQRLRSEGSPAARRIGTLAEWRAVMGQGQARDGDIAPNWRPVAVRLTPPRRG